MNSMERSLEPITRNKGTPGRFAMSHFSDVSLAPHEALAVAVIRLALHDARLQGARGEHARRFLAGSDGLAFWCHVANVPTALIVTKAREAVPGLALQSHATAA